MYWYPFSDEEENKAWAQAEAQAADTDDENDGTKKFIGNLGEIAFHEYLKEYVNDGTWEYHNKSELEDGNPEYNTVDFSIGSRHLDVDVKTSMDVRKFNPEMMLHAPGAFPASKGYPRVKTDESDVLVFILLDRRWDISPNSEIRPDEVSTPATGADQYVVERSGKHVAALLGWLYTSEFTGEAMVQLTGEARGKFTQLGLRDFHDLLFRADALA